MAHISALLLPAGSRLLPASKILLPPASGSMLMSDGSAAGHELAAQFDRAGAEARKMASRGAAEAKILADRMAGIAADKIPEIKKRARELAASANAALADRAGRDAFIAAHKQALVIGAAALLVLSGTGYVFAKHQATAIAKNRIDGFLNRTGLASSFTYTDISASLLGSVTLSGVTVKRPGLGVIGKVAFLEVSGIKTNGDALVAANLAATAFEIPIVGVARQYREVPIITAAMGLGYATLKGDLSLSVVFDDEKKTFSFSTKGNVRDLGTVDANVKFGGISSSLVGALIAMIQSEQQSATLELMTGRIAALQRVMQATLMDADVAIDNVGWFAREREITALNMPGTDSEVSAPSPGDFKAAMVELERVGVDPTNAKAAIESAWKWSAVGGALRITTHIGEPIPLLRSSGSFGGQAFTFDSVPKFLAVTKAKVSN